jgi:hypothetical protein
MTAGPNARAVERFTGEDVRAQDEADGEVRDHIDAVAPSDPPRWRTRRAYMSPNIMTVSSRRACVKLEATRSGEAEYWCQGFEVKRRLRSKDIVSSCGSHHLRTVALFIVLAVSFCTFSYFTPVIWDYIRSHRHRDHHQEEP